jgi:carboxylesterase
MIHQEYIRKVPGADTAVLFVHGIVGTPNHFTDLISLVELVPESWSVHNVLLDGHGGNADDFADTSMEKWKNQVHAAFDSLARTHRRVVIVAHSMGTLFALQLALEFPEKIPFLFLLGVPLWPGVRFGMAVNSMRMVFGILPKEHILWKAAGVTTTPKVWKYIRWIPRFLELFREIGVTETQLSDLKVPCVAYQSRKDELVTNFTAPILRKSGVMEVCELPKSSHFYYTEEDKAKICEDFTRRLAQL